MTQLSPKELEEVLTQLKAIFPDRKVEPLVSNVPLCSSTLGKPIYENKKLTLEKELEVLYSFQTWDIKSEPYRLIRPLNFNIFVQTFVEPFSDIFKMNPKKREKIREKINEENNIIKKAFIDVGLGIFFGSPQELLPNVYFESLAKHYKISKDNLQKKVWTGIGSNPITFADKEIPNMMFWQDERMQPRYQGVLIFPGFYPVAEDGETVLLGNLFPKRQGRFLVCKMTKEDPYYNGGHRELCSNCKGSKYDIEDEPHFLFIQGGQAGIIPIACEYCVDEILGDIAGAFIKSKK